MDAGDRLERDVLAACIAFPALHDELREMPSENFDNEIHRRLRAVILKEDSGDEVVVAELAELDAIAAAEGIDRRPHASFSFACRPVSYSGNFSVPSHRSSRDCRSV